MSTKLENYIKNKQTIKKSEVEVSDKKSPYMELLYKEIEKALLGKIKTLHGEDGHTPTKEEILAVLTPHIDNAKNEIQKNFTKEKLLKMIASMIPKVEDGKTPKKGKDYFTKEEAEEFLKLSTPVKGKHYFDGTPGTPGKNAVLPSLYKLAINTINVIETLEGEDRIDAKAIKNLEKLIRQIVSQETVGYNAGGPGVIFHDSTITGTGTPTDPLSVIMGTNNLVNNEIVAGTDGLHWTLANTPAIGSVHVYANGQRLTLTVDYTIAGSVITTLQSWAVGTILADYSKQ